MRPKAAQYWDAVGNEGAPLFFFLHQFWPLDGCNFTHLEIFHGLLGHGQQ